MNPIGMKFNKLTVIKKGINTYKKKQTVWLCKCDCGNTTTVPLYRLTSNNTKSCGCLQGKGTHGYSKHPSYNSWRGAKDRCLNEKNKDFKKYGKRGITFGKKWLDIKTFISDMGSPPTKEHSLDRINNNKGYYKDNCRWATRIEQGNNQSTNRLISYMGKTKTIANWARELHINQSILRGRMKSGRTLEEAVLFEKRGEMLFLYRKNKYKIKQLSEISGVSVSIINQRIFKLNWSIEKVMNTPRRKQKMANTANDNKKTKGFAAITGL